MTTTTTRERVAKLGQDAKVLGRAFIDQGENRAREAASAALGAAEKVLLEARKRVHTLRTRVKKDGE